MWKPSCDVSIPESRYSRGRPEGHSKDARRLLPEYIPRRYQGAGFEHWIGNLPVFTSLSPDAEPAALIPHIKWASRARWVYSEHIEALLCSSAENLPYWVHFVYKIGRYFAAAKAMLKLAATQPALFTSIHIEVVDAPEQQNFSLKEDRAALKTVLQRLTKADHQRILSQLGQIWLTEDPELRFRLACRLKLTVHAEMQLLSFYDHHTELTPRPLFMETSKKACFLCHIFMSRHPLRMSVAASHQKLYPTWMPAPCSISSVRKEHKVLLWELCRHLEQTTARDLETRLGTGQRKRKHGLHSRPFAHIVGKRYFKLVDRRVTSPCEIRQNT